MKLGMTSSMNDAAEPRCASCGGKLDPDQASAPTASGRMLCDADWWKEEVEGAPYVPAHLRVLQ